MDLVASDSAQQDLSGTVSSIQICGRIWKIGDPIHTGAMEIKWWNLCCAASHTTMVEGVYLGKGSGKNLKKY